MASTSECGVLNLRGGDKLQLQEVKSAVLHMLHVADLHFKKGRKLWEEPEYRPEDILE